MVKTGGQEGGEVRLCVLSWSDVGVGSGSSWVSFMDPAPPALATGLASLPVWTPPRAGSSFLIQQSSGHLTILSGFFAFPSPRQPILPIKRPLFEMPGLLLLS